MGWFKLDDTVTQPDEPLSAFIGYSLTRNVNAYPSALARLATFTYPTTAAGQPTVKWASFWEPRSTVLTVDVGINAFNFIVKVYFRLTNTALGGNFYLRHIDSSTQVTVPVASTVGATMIEIPFSTLQPLSGLQGFLFGWQSDVSEEPVGSVELVGAVGNQVFCEPNTGTPFPFTLATGSYTEMYHLLKIDPASTRPAPAARALLNYQVCAFRHNTNPDRPPHGVLLIWPELETQPAILPTATAATGGTKMTGSIYELGRLELYSITFEVARALDQELLAPYAYQQTTAINAINNKVNASMMLLQPDAGTLLSSGGFLGCVLPAGEAATFAFFVQNRDVVLTLQVSFRAITFNDAQTSNPTITFRVRNPAGTTVGNVVTQTDLSIPRFTGQTTRASSPTTTIAMNGVLAGDQKWGMRDAMTVREINKGTPVRFQWGPNTVGAIDRGTVYYGSLTATSDLYIFGFNCRVL